MVLSAQIVSVILIALLAIITILDFTRFEKARLGLSIFTLAISLGYIIAVVVAELIIGVT